MRRSLKRPIHLQGVGVHSGAPARLTLRPSAPETGYVVHRRDLTGEAAFIPARYDLVTDTRLCTKLTNAHGGSVGTVEHLMAALAGCGVDDVLVEIDGPEVPIMDGGSRPFVEAILAAGLSEADAPLQAIRILAPVEVRHEDKLARLEPCARFEGRFMIEFPDPAIGRQEIALDLTGDAFVEELAAARTFGRLFEIEKLREMGLTRGGSLENAVVVDGGRVLNPGGLRWSDEFVRHKMLDAVGDLALAGAPILGRYVGEKAGHDMTNRLLRALFAAPHLWRFESVEGARGAVLPDALPLSLPLEAVPPVAAGLRATA
ncbi:UDP-3-O-acyl-N-acetylglucosamine deacetylase [Neomegalonema perideroedes]|uniref:UDP-3-O-acyl-N-acetylglucosamine deacetylase n=1 Tax=Neomegalonema perideroedes TaxID=217219 RepID=UPI0006861B71|nr:UDP-3-O-acyl-N-acetylglucosamine deacetylase [Neomegalonema perideroedes]